MQTLRASTISKWFFKLAMAVLFCISPVAAQETLPDNKGELKDFRLDTPPPKEKAAEPAPKVELPAERPVIKTATQPVKPVQRPVAQKVQASAPKPAQNVAPIDTKTAADAPTGGFSDIPPQSDVSTSTAPEDAASVGAPVILDYTAYWPWFAALLAAILGFALFWIWRHRHAKAPVEERNDFKATTPIVPASPSIAKPLVVSSNLTVRFDPVDARLSVANLTVKGHLHLRYDGDAPLETLKLRTRAMSACDGQKALIDAFHSDPAAGEIESLGPVVPGEEINLTLEIQVPRDALQAFDWRERLFVAPIVLINIASDDAAIIPSRISCVVGQEGSLGSARLQPIPIDRGPKLFDSLQFRPIAA